MPPGKKFYCRKCVLIVDVGDVTDTVTGCPKCGEPMIAVMSGGASKASLDAVQARAANYNASGILRAAAQLDGEIVAGSDTLAFHAGGDARGDLRDTPFIFCAARCPMCGKDTEQRYFKANIYYVSEHDIDLKPRTLAWQKPEFATFNPAFYYMWHCPGCKFTANRNAFEDPTVNTILTPRLIASAYATASKDPARAEVVALLSDSIDMDAMDFPSAFKLYLLAIYELEWIKAVVERDALTLGQYYLRLAWLYRDFASVAASAEHADKKLAFKVKYLLASAAKLWPDLPGDESDALARSSYFYQLSFERSPVVSQKGIDHNIAEILARICMRQEDMKGAREWLAAAIRSARHRHDALARELRDAASRSPPPSKEALVDMKREARRLESFLTEAHALGKTLPGGLE